MSTELQRQPSTQLSEVQRTVDAIDDIRHLVGKSMTKDLDYGIIPGTSQKPTLYLPGAQKALLYFNSYPTFELTKTPIGEAGHCEVDVKCVVISRNNGNVIAEGVGSCSTMEGKYRWRNSSKKCPKCGKEAIIKGKAEYGGGWVCFEKKGGCKAKFRDGAVEIESQATGKVENPDIWDIRNTVLKIAKKRALIDAALTLSCLSEFFTQDLEFHEQGVEEETPRQQRQEQRQEQPPHDEPRQGQEAEADFAAIEQSWKDRIDATENVGTFDVVAKQVTIPSVREYVKEVAHKRGYWWARDVQMFQAPSATNGTPNPAETTFNAAEWIERIRRIENDEPDYLESMNALAADIVAIPDPTHARATWAHAHKSVMEFGRMNNIPLKWDKDRKKWVAVQIPAHAV